MVYNDAGELFDGPFRRTFDTNESVKDYQKRFHHDPVVKKEGIEPDAGWLGDMFNGHMRNF